MKEHDKVQTRLLIAEQINNNYSEHEKELVDDIENLKQQFIGQLSCKNYMMQNLEQKYEQALDILKELAKKDQQIRNLLNVVGVDSKTNYKLSDSIELSRDLITNGRICTTTTDPFERPYRERKYSLKVGKSYIEEGKGSLEAELENLKKKVNELHGINLKLNDALRLSNEKIIELCTKQASTADTNDITQLFNSKTTLKRWQTTYAKGRGGLQGDRKNSVKLNTMGI